MKTRNKNYFILKLLCYKWKPVILFFATILFCLSNIYAQKKFKTDSGFVFIDGRYIESPYLFEIRQDSVLYINNEEIFARNIRSYKHNKKIKKFPGFPDSTYKFISYKEMRDFKVPGENYTYIGAARDYYYTHFDKDSAYVLLADYIRKLPWVKSYDSDGKSWLLENYVGEKNYYIAFIPRYQYDNFINPPSKRKYYKGYKQRLISDVNLYISFLNNNRALFFFKDNSYQTSEFFNTNKLPRIIEILDDTTTSFETKLNLFNSESIWLNSPDSRETKYFIENYQPNKELRKKIERLIKNNSLPKY